MKVTIVDENWEDSIKSSNTLAEKITKAMGIWQVQAYRGLVDVEIIGISESFWGRKYVRVRALKGKPWREKVAVGEGQYQRRATNIAVVRPGDLTKKEMPTTETECERCQGSGRINVHHYWTERDGEDDDGGDPCPDCDGQGVIKTEMENNDD